MICPKCGNFCKERERFCACCGEPLMPAPSRPNGWRQSPPPQEAQQRGTRQEMAGGGAPPIFFPQQPESTGAVRGMYWFRFLVYFQLFVSAALNLLYGVECLTGKHYQQARELVYWVIPELRRLDIFYGSVLLVLAAFAIFTRMRLVRFRKNGPKFYLVYLGLQIATSLLYTIAVKDIAISATNYYATFHDFSGYLFSLAANIVLLSASIIYFKKRKHMFVH